MHSRVPVATRCGVALVALVAVAGSVLAGIRPNEALQISISGVPDPDRQNITAVYPVSGEGTINLPYVGIIEASGLEPMKLAKRIERAYRAAEIFSNPTVNVTVVGDGRLNRKTVVVGGQVKRAGIVDFTEGMTLWQAVQAAGGDTPFGAVRRVELDRRGEVRVFDLRRHQARNEPLRENDSIHMPQKRPWEGGW